mmetsp:Transcript_56433/g.99130  ORF Transcript_56433/g.99130 Transcript_56433/m.99130 type:complete len:284 (-) Transcript_56433:544-1395(-)
MPVHGVARRVHLGSGGLDDFFVQHGRLALHDVVVAVEANVHAVLVQQGLEVEDHSVHHSDIRGLGAAISGVQVHRAVATEDDPGSNRAVHALEVVLQPKPLLRADIVVVLSTHTDEVDHSHVVAPPGLVGGGRRRHGQKLRGEHTTLSAGVRVGVQRGRAVPVTLVVAHRGEVRHRRGDGGDHVHEEIPHGQVARGVGDVSTVVDHVGEAVGDVSADRLHGQQGRAAVLVPRVRGVVAATTEVVEEDRAGGAHGAVGLGEHAGHWGHVEGVHGTEVIGGLVAK